MFAGIGSEYLNREYKQDAVLERKERGSVCVCLYRIGSAGELRCICPGSFG